MKHDEFIGRVQHLGHMSSRGQAEAATRATLETLAECVPPDSAHNLAAQLPPEIGRYLEDHRFDRSARDEFFERIHSREGHADLPESAYHARAVAEVLRDAVSPGALEHVLGELPQRFRTLFHVGAEGTLRWSDNGA